MGSNMFTTGIKATIAMIASHKDKLSFAILSQRPQNS